MISIRLLLALSAAAVLSACGADTASPPGPIATQSPVPAPTPTPTYTAFDDLTGDQRFNLACVVTYNAIFPLDYDSFLEFDAELQSWRVFATTDDPNSGMIFDREDIVDPKNDETIAFYADLTPEEPNGFFGRFAISAPVGPNGESAQYVRMMEFKLIARNGHVLEQDHCIFGVPTQSDDVLPETETAYGSGLTVIGRARTIRGSNIQMDGSADITVREFEINESDIGLSYRPENADLALAIDLLGRELTIDPATGEVDSAEVLTPLGSFAENAPLIDQYRASSFEDSDSEQLPVIGWLFGPHGSEIGLVTLGSSGLQPDPNSDDYTDTDFYLIMAGKAD